MSCDACVTAAITAQTLAFTPEFIAMATAQTALTAAAVPYYVERLAADTQNDSADIIGVIAALASLTVAIKYQQLADDYYHLYDRQRKFYYTNFQNNINGESGLVAQVFALPLYSPQYFMEAASLCDFADPETPGNMGAFSSVWWANHAHMYQDTPFVSTNNAFRTGNTLAFTDLMDSEAAIDDAVTYLYRYEEHRKDVYDERNWEWQNQALNYALKQANLVESGFATSFKFLDESMGNMSDFFATQSNGLSKHSAYIHSLASNSANLAATAQKGSGLAMSTNLGQDRGRDRISKRDFESTDVISKMGFQ